MTKLSKQPPKTTVARPFVGARGWGYMAKDFPHDRFGYIEDHYYIEFDLPLCPICGQEVGHEYRVGGWPDE